MLEMLNRYPVLLEDKSVKETKAILSFTSSTIKANFEVTLPAEENDKKFAETLTKCEKLIFEKLYKDKAEAEQFEKINDTIAKMTQATKDMQSKVDTAVVELTGLVTSGLSNLSATTKSEE